MDRKLSGTRIRIHGDFHLGQVLHTGKDFIIIDFEGEPTRPLSERRLKRSPLRDVAGMLRSFHYAAYVSALDSRIRPEDASLVDSLARVWYTWISASYLGAYLKTAATGSILPKTNDDIQGLLDAFLLEKSIYEMVYELNSRPNWLRIPLRGILQLFAVD
jgi:maltose alpha-D-glucosyltransferase/alpha-amylase